MIMQTNILTGNALIWAVAHAMGYNPVLDSTGYDQAKDRPKIAYRSKHGSWVHPRFTDDNEAAELMSLDWIGVERPSHGQITPLWRALTDNKLPRSTSSLRAPVVDAWGEKLGIVVCRVLVLSRVGEKIDIPEQLLD